MAMSDKYTYFLGEAFSESQWAGWIGPLTYGSFNDCVSGAPGYSPFATSVGEIQNRSDAPNAPIWLGRCSLTHYVNECLSRDRKRTRAYRLDDDDPMELN